MRRCWGWAKRPGWIFPASSPARGRMKPPEAGGVGMMTTFGDGIPGDAAGTGGAAFAPSPTAARCTTCNIRARRRKSSSFKPKVKRPLELAPNGIDDIKVGMRGAVDFGTARRAGYDPNEPILGKTGTCTDFRDSSHMGWFGSFNEVGRISWWSW